MTVTIAENVIKVIATVLLILKVNCVREGNASIIAMEMVFAQY